jgi:integrase
MGCIYLRGNTYWIKYYRKGKPYQESSRSTKETDAKRLLHRREGEISEGKLPGIVFDKVRFDELAEELLSDYRVNSRKSLDRVELSITHLKGFFEGGRVPEITTPKIHKYIEARMGEGAENGTINRELAALRRMLNLGAQQTPPKVNRVPFIPMLKENGPRQGFFEYSDFLSLRNALPEYLRGYVTFAYRSGWRKKEIINLTWDRVNLAQRIVRLEPGTTKNNEGRTMYLDDELLEVFTRQWENRKKAQKIMPYVFLNYNGMSKIGDYRNAWHAACKKAKIGYKILHDCRRSAVRNMVRSGVPEQVAMTISGHKTRNVFERYNIVSDDDIQAAAARQEAYLKAQMVTNTVTILQLNPKSAGK